MMIRNCVVALFLAGISALGLAACDAQTDEVEATTGALGVWGWPQGLTCGLGYYRNGVNVAAGYCQGAATANSLNNACDYNAWGRPPVRRGGAAGGGMTMAAARATASVGA